MKIGEEYNSKKIVNAKYPLEIWFNNLIEKEYEDITVHDICIMLRQSVFVEVALSRSIHFLDENPLAGDLFVGELLRVILEKNKDYVKCNRILFRGYIDKAIAVLNNTDPHLGDDCFELTENEIASLFQMFKEMESIITVENS